jgi:hypothetical protein
MMVRRWNITVGSFVFLFLFFNGSIVHSEDQFIRNISGGHEHSGHNPAISLISFYQKYISPIDGKSCPSYPSCSSYSKQAIKKHGFIMGWIMTVDRLIHEGRDETKVSPYISVNGRWKIYDPVENNDFWWYKENKREKSVSVSD